jgi:hypothetical protein
MMVTNFSYTTPTIKRLLFSFQGQNLIEGSSCDGYDVFHIVKLIDHTAKTLLNTNDLIEIKNELKMLSQEIKTVCMENLCLKVK